MISIKKPNVVSNDGKAILSADVVVDGDKHCLWVGVEEEFGNYLCYERSDAFVLGLLQYAIRYGHNIECEVPMTDRLYEQLHDQFLPALCKMNPKSVGRMVTIKCDLAPEIEHPTGGQAIGTGCSCGVDSLHVYSAHQDITHGCIWNVHGITVDEDDEKRKVGWVNLVSHSRQFAHQAGIKLVVADSNYDRGCLPDLLFDGGTTFGNLFFIFALQKLWKKFYVASGYDITDFKLDFSGDPAHYEYLLFSFCSLANISILLDGVAQRRIDKVADLKHYPLAKKHLNVCWNISENGNNCSYRCAKCMRTMLDLDMVDALDSFDSIFDVDYYRKNFHEYLAEFYRGCLHKDSFALELRPYMKQKHISIQIRVKALIIVTRKILRKIFRLGKRDYSRFSSKG